MLIKTMSREEHKRKVDIFIINLRARVNAFGVPIETKLKISNLEYQWRKAIARETVYQANKEACLAIYSSFIFLGEDGRAEQCPVENIPIKHIWPEFNPHPKITHIK